ncbi:MAG: hypothetical protein AAFQ29_05760 [Pseudomonadota bacterium]
MEKMCQKRRFTAAAFLSGPPSFERDKHGRDVASFAAVARIVITSSGEHVQSSWCSCFRVRIWDAELVEGLRWRDFAAADRINVSGRFLAELGCTELEIMAVTGHSTSKEVERYTKAARRRLLAERAMSKLSESKNK